MNSSSVIAVNNKIVSVQQRVMDLGDNDVVHFVVVKKGDDVPRAGIFYSNPPSIMKRALFKNNNMKDYETTLAKFENARDKKEALKILKDAFAHNKLTDCKSKNKKKIKQSEKHQSLKKKRKVKALKRRSGKKDLSLKPKRTSGSKK